jgi:hypothetical protein
MAFEGVFVLGAEGERDSGVVIEDAVVLAGAGVVEFEAVEGGPFVIAEAEPPSTLLVQGEVAPAVVGPRRRYALAIDEVDLVAVPEGRRALFEGALLDVVEGAFAAGWAGRYGDSREGSKRSDLGKE